MLAWSGGAARVMGPWSEPALVGGKLGRAVGVHKPGTTPWGLMGGGKQALRNAASEARRKLGGKLAWVGA